MMSGVRCGILRQELTIECVCVCVCARVRACVCVCDLVVSILCELCSENGARARACVCFTRYAGESGTDAGGLRRQFFDLFTTQLKESPFWCVTATGSLRPADISALGAASRAADEGALRQNMETCGRVCHFRCLPKAR